MEKALYSIIKDSERIQTENIEKKYLSDNLERKVGSAGALVFPISTEEVSGVLKYAYEHNIPVTPRGAGTNLVGSTVPHGNGIVLDLSLMNHILEVDEETFTATVEPGVVLEDFQAYVEERDLFYPPDPGEKKATIGGNISTNAGGMRAVKYGVTGDYVMGLELVRADGSILTVGGKNRKDTSGLSIKDIVIGSEGTLAVITKCVLKLIPKPEKSISVLISYDSLKSGIESVRKIIQANINPTAIEFIERKVVKLGEEYLHLTFPQPDAKAYLLLTFDGKKNEIDGNIKQLEAVAGDCGAISVLPLTDKEAAADVWKIRGVLVKAVEAVSEQEPLDVVVPINQIDTFVNFIHELEQKNHIRLISFGHAGDGNVHLCVVRGNRSDEEWEHDLDENLNIIYNKAHELGGLISGEHGIGLSKQKYFFKETNPENLLLMNQIKNAFDSKHILNDGISYVFSKQGK
ncbi:MAG: FAD-binding oxidoreductase [Lachnospiraceae bacterium]|nr:FAD-binding oxidoreductase [Lachnospiraceae bacterium]